MDQRSTVLYCLGGSNTHLRACPCANYETSWLPFNTVYRTTTVNTLLLMYYIALDNSYNTATILLHMCTKWRVRPVQLCVLTLGTHAQQGYGSQLVCVHVSVYLSITALTATYIILETKRGFFMVF